MKPKCPPSWRVELAEHDVERWHVPARSVEVPAVSADDAALRVIRWAHADVGVPPWRPFTRASTLHAIATPTEAEVVPIVLGQLELPRAA